MIAVVQVDVHSGPLDTLPAVVAHFDRGEREDLIAFLESLDAR